jgi:hypothetical protein
MRRRIIAATLFAATGGCAPSEEEGAVEVRIWGEDFIEDGIPADVFVDGWTVSFSRFLVAVDGIATPEAEDPRRYLFDISAPTDGEGTTIAELPSASGSTELAYRIGPGPAADGGNATADAGMMADNGYAIYVEGTATKDAQNISFAWGFAAETSYHECEVAEDVPAGGVIPTLVTIHADHLFYDDLEAPEPDVTFDLVASADADMNATVTAEELAVVSILGEATYQVGSRDIDNLWDFIEAQSQTVGHIDGEGHCHTE